MKSITTRLMAFVFFACALPHLVLAQGDNSAKNTTNKMNIISFNKYLPNAIVNSGFFVMKKSENSYCVEMTDKKQRNHQHYMIENCFDTTDVAKSDNLDSSISRKSGIIEFQNTTQNTGKFTFTKNPDFVDFLKDEGVQLDNDLYYFKLFLGDIDKNYVLDIKKLGFQPTIVELGRLVWHDASVDYIEEVHILYPNFNLADISMISAHNIPIEYLKGFADLGIKEVTARSIKKAKKYGLTPQIIEEQRRLGKNFPDLDSYVRLLKKKEKEKEKR